MSSTISTSIKLINKNTVYLNWKAEGNEPLPADEPVTP